MFLVIEYLVIGDYLELGIWLLEFHAAASQLAESGGGRTIMQEIGSCFSLESLFKQDSDKFRIGHSLNVDGSGHSGTRRDVGIRIDF